MGENEKKLDQDFQKNIDYLNEKLAVNASFDIIYRVIQVGGKNACMYLIDGFCKDDLMQKLLQFLVHSWQQFTLCLLLVVFWLTSAVMVRW